MLTRGFVKKKKSLGMLHVYLDWPLYLYEMILCMTVFLLIWNLSFLLTSLCSLLLSAVAFYYLFIYLLVFYLFHLFFFFLICFLSICFTCFFSFPPSICLLSDCVCFIISFHLFRSLISYNTVFCYFNGWISIYRVYL